jgi:hypothetical protein
MGAIALLSRENLHRDLAKKVGKKKTTREVFEAGPLLQMITRAYDTPALMGGAR